MEVGSARTRYLLPKNLDLKSRARTPQIKNLVILRKMMEPVLTGTVYCPPKTLDP